MTSHQATRSRVHRLPHRLSAILALLIALACLASTGPAFGSDYVAGFIQVHLAPGYTIESVNAQYGTSTADELPPHYLLQVPEGVDEETLIAQMIADPATFICAERAYRDETPEGVRQMVVAAVGATIDDYLDQNLAERIHLEQMHAYSRGEGVIVAVLDTGVLASHECLAGFIAPGGYDFVEDDTDPNDTANGLDDDNDGLTDEGAGHGTLVAGIVHLVAPEARILPIRVLDDEGRGTTFALAKGIRHAVEMGADVINMSLGLTDRSGIVSHELAAARLQSAAMVSAAGNLGVENVLYFPASDSRVLMVAALDSCDVKAEFSNYHRKVSVSAPGVGILGPYYDGGYAIGAGTSFATPFITGQCALIRSLVPGIEWMTIYDQVYEGIEDIYSLPGNLPYLGRLGTGRFDALETLLTTIEPSDVSRDVDLLAALRLAPNPVPAGSQARISWNLPRAEDVSEPSELRIYDAAGRLARALTAAPGTQSLVWDGCDTNGRLVEAGIYLIRLSSARSVGEGRMILVR